jgi:nucleoside 2-deoxyribosyltransferase
MAKIYLANQFHLKNETQQYAKELTALGHEITAAWLNEPDQSTDSLHAVTFNFSALVAKQDLYDISYADTFVVFKVDPDQSTRRGGRHVETGAALLMGKRVIVCGPRENIFHSLPQVIVVKDFDELKKVL